MRTASRNWVNGRRATSRPCALPIATGTRASSTRVAAARNRAAAHWERSQPSPLRSWKTWASSMHRVTYESESHDSCDHPVNVRAVVQPQAGERWVVVTSAMHMPRVVGCFRAAGWADVIPYPTDFKVALGLWGAGTFQVADNLSLLDTALHEWVGLAYYRLTGRIAEFLPAP